MSVDYWSLGSGKQNYPCKSVAEAHKSFYGQPLQHTLCSSIHVIHNILKNRLKSVSEAIIITILMLLLGCILICRQEEKDIMFDIKGFLGSIQVGNSHTS